MSVVSLELELDLGEFDSVLRDPLLNAQELDDIANRAVLMIVRKTSEGVDAFGVAFQPYSEKYARYKQNRGRSDVVNMSFTNQMLGALRGSSFGDTALVHFANQSAAQIADYHVSPEPRSKVPRRNFLDLDGNGTDAKVLAEMAAEFVARKF